MIIAEQLNANNDAEQINKMACKFSKASDENFAAAEQQTRLGLEQ